MIDWKINDYKIIARKITYEYAVERVINGINSFPFFKCISFLLGNFQLSNILHYVYLLIELNVA